MIITGKIDSFDETSRILTITYKRSYLHLYLQKSTLQMIERFIKKGRNVSFLIKQPPILRHDKHVLVVNHILKIYEKRIRRDKVFYCLSNIKKDIKQLINNLEYKLFLDIEMSMHPYYKTNNFTQEIIQVGYLLVDQNNNVIKTFDHFIKPVKHKVLTKRTIKFLSITQNDVDSGIEYDEFYNEYASIVKKYNPAIIVWGKNDMIALKESYEISNKKSLKPYSRFINLLSLHKTYYSLRNDLGLFNALKLYKPFDDHQTHNAYEDALVTKEIFDGFKEVLNTNKLVDTSEYM